MELQEFWDSIPIGRANRLTYSDFCDKWGVNRRCVRHIMHMLSEFDSGDGYVLIRSSQCRGFYKTNDADEIERYRREIISRAVNTFAPLKKINRVLGENENQMVIDL